MRQAAAAILAGLAGAASAQPNPYRTLPQWADVRPAAAALGSVSAVYPDADGRVWVAEMLEFMKLRFAGK